MTPGGRDDLRQVRDGRGNLPDDAVPLLPLQPFDREERELQARLFEQKNFVGDESLGRARVAFQDVADFGLVGLHLLRQAFFEQRFDARRHRGQRVQVDVVDKGGRGLVAVQAPHQRLQQPFGRQRVGVNHFKQPQP